jgi:adenosine deaminase CECR1
MSATPVQLSDYYARRAALVSEDRSLRRENLRASLVTEDEKRADAVVRSIRAREAETIWKDKSIENIFPGMGFLTGLIKHLFCLYTSLTDLTSKIYY